MEMDRSWSIMNMVAPMDLRMESSSESNSTSTQRLADVKSGSSVVASKFMMDSMSLEAHMMSRDSLSWFRCAYLECEAAPSDIFSLKSHL